MKTIIGILLVSLLGFLGCGGDSDAGTAAVPGEANPVAPFGIIDTMAPEYEWTPVPGATRYRLLVQDEDDTVVIDELYTAEESGCAAEEVSCRVHPGIVTIGKNTWKVQACATQECGLWSEPLHYDMLPTPVSNFDRYIVHGDGTITDTMTLLRWTDASIGSRSMTWDDAIIYCEDLTLGGYDDWVLPELNELNSLRDQCICTNCRLDIPYKHPMWGGLRIWSATKFRCPAPGWCLYYVYQYGACTYHYDWSTTSNPTWCVRNRQNQ